MSENANSFVATVWPAVKFNPGYRQAPILDVHPDNTEFADPERLAKMKVGYVNQYAWRGGAAYWGKPHSTREQAENAEKYAGWNGKRVVARAVVRWKPKSGEKYPELRPGTVWRHTSGRLYKIMAITNLPDDDRYPLTVAYKGENGALWSRRADDWHRSMKRVRNSVWVLRKSPRTVAPEPPPAAEWDPQP